MPLLVRAFPLIAPVDDAKAFAASLKNNAEETAAFYRHLGVSHESWHVQESAQGRLLIGVTKVDDLAAGERYAAADAAFVRNFKDAVRRMSGVDPDREPLGPPTTCIFDWSDEQVSHSNLCA
jgi:hypothetical protein